ncbi:MAG: hypothetical protein ACP5O1_09475 [Phycisphaerae bacterium]
MKWGRAVFWLVVGATLIALGIHLTRDYRSHDAQLAQLKKERAELQAIIKRLTGRTQEAQLVVDEQVLNRRGRVVQTTLLWREFTFTNQGRRVALPLQRIVIPGDEPYIGGYVLKFADSFVEAGNALRGKSLGFFTRIFSNSQAPDRGTSLLGREGVPRVLEPRYGPPNPFALSLWQQIQRLIRSRRADKKLGLQVVQLQYVAKPVRPGVLYTIYLQNDGGFEFIAERGHKALMDRLLHQSLLPGPK